MGSDEGGIGMRLKGYIVILDPLGQLFVWIGLIEMP